MEFIFTISVSVSIIVLGSVSTSLAVSVPVSTSTFCTILGSVFTSLVFTKSSSKFWPGFKFKISLGCLGALMLKSIGSLKSLVLLVQSTLLFTLQLPL